MFNRRKFLHGIGTSDRVFFCEEFFRFYRFTYSPLLPPLGITKILSKILYNEARNLPHPTLLMIRNYALASLRKTRKGKTKVLRVEVLER